MSGGDPAVDVEVYVHAAGTSVWEEQSRFVRRAEELADRSVVRGVSVRAWPRRVCVAGGLEQTPFHREALATIDRLREWADRAGVALPFERHAVVSEFARTEHEVVDTPAVCVVATEGDRLRWVYPHSHGSSSCSTADLLERVAREGGVPGDCQPAPSSSVRSPSVSSTDGA